MNSALLRIAVFASGQGSNFQAIIDAIAANRLPAKIVLLISDRADALALQRAKKHSIPHQFVNPKDFANRQLFDQRLLALTQAAQADLVVLAGFMRLLSKAFLDGYPNRIINIHPSLLPAFPGKEAIAQALAAQVKSTGVTVHWVDEGLDSGPVIKQESLPILPNDTHATLAERLHRLEHDLLIRVLQELSQNLKRR